MGVFRSGDGMSLDLRGETRYVRRERTKEEEGRRDRS